MCKFSSVLWSMIEHLPKDISQVKCGLLARSLITHGPYQQLGVRNKRFKSHPEIGGKGKEFFLKS